LKNIQKINKIDFYVDLANLSYMGDIRTYLRAEKKDKIKNVVIGAIEYYDDIYRDIIEKYNISKDPQIFEFIPEMNLRHLENLPYPFVNSLMSYTKEFNKEEFKYNFCRNMNNNERRYIIDSYLEKRNFLYSCKGIISGVYSTDLNKSLKYVFEKYRKSLNII
jgi:hypothetical protein